MQTVAKAVDHVQAARALHQRVVDEVHLGYGASTIQGFSDQIRMHLSAARSNFSALDPNGERSHREMAISLRATFSLCHLHSARGLFKEIEMGARKPVCSSHLRAKVRHIAEHMALIKINGRKLEDWACLDENGISSGQEIKNRIDRAIMLADSNMTAILRRMSPEYSAGLPFRPR